MISARVCQGSRRDFGDGQIQSRQEILCGAQEDSEKCPANWETSLILEVRRYAPPLMSM